MWTEEGEEESEMTCSERLQVTQITIQAEVVVLDSGLVDSK